MRIIAGARRGRKLEAPAGEATRPTSDRAREALFSMLQSRLGSFDELAVADLFAGTGALGLEALSRGAAHVTFVENGAEGRGLIRDHIEDFGIAGITKLLRRDATDLGVPGTFGQFDLVFLDPPYGRQLGEQAVAQLLSRGWLADGATLVWEESVDIPITVPDGLTLEDRREYGAAAVHFLTAG